MTGEVLVAENVELKIDTLSNATKQGASLSRWEVIEAVVKSLSPEDRKRLETYRDGER